MLSCYVMVAQHVPHSTARTHQELNGKRGCEYPDRKARSTYEVEVRRVESYSTAVAALCGRAVVTTGQMNKPIVQPSRLRPEHRPRRGQRLFAPRGTEAAPVG